MSLCEFETQDCIIFSDRGMLDNFAYTSPEVEKLIFEMKKEWNLDLLSNHSYDGVLHLVTAADGAEEHYTKDNNKARSETPEEARALDKLTQGKYSFFTNINRGVEVSFESCHYRQRKLQRV